MNKIKAFKSRWKSFAKYIKIYTKNEKDLSDVDKSDFLLIATKLDDLGLKSFTLNRQEISELINYDEKSLQIFFELPIINDYIREYEKELLQVNLRKKLNKLDKADLSKEDIQTIGMIMKSLDKYIDSNNKHTYIMSYLPALTYKDLSKK